MKPVTVICAERLIELRPVVINGIGIKFVISNGVARMPLADAIRQVPIEGDPLTGAPMLATDARLDDGEAIVRSLMDGYARNDPAMADYRASIAQIDAWAANAMVAPIGAWRADTMVSESRRADWVRALRYERSAIRIVRPADERPPDAVAA